MQEKTIKSAFSLAFAKTLPIFAGFIFLGITYGIFMNKSGFSFIFPTMMSLTILGGSIEFIVVGLLSQKFDPMSVFVLTLIINSRHIFYGFSMLERYKNVGLKKFYLIFGMCDESFSINYTTQLPEQIDRGWFMFFVTLLNHSYWVVGATLGGLLGNLITVKLVGLDFVMTALFIVLFLNNFKNEKSHFSSAVGFLVAILALLVVGKTIFILVTMLVMIALFTVINWKGVGKHVPN